jgi:hypothetical protein
MRIVSEEESEECLGGGFMKDVRLDEPVTMDFVDYLRNFGEVTLIKGLKRPFYTFDREYFFTLKGIVGEKAMKVVHRPAHVGLTSGFLAKIMANFSAGEKGLTETKKMEASVFNEIKSSK